MANKKKGHLTTSPEWAKHLRQYMKRRFWKGERNASKENIKTELDENKNAGINNSLSNAFYEFDENWKNAVHKLDFETADFWFDKRKRIILDGLVLQVVSEKEYYYQIAAHHFYKGDNLHKAKAICERAISKGLTTTRMVELSRKTATKEA